MKKRIITLTVCFGFFWPNTLLAQQAVVTSPSAAATNNVSSTIAVTNTFQSLQARTTSRKGCLVQNNSASASMWVFFGTLSAATKAKSVVLSAGQAVSCSNMSGAVLVDQVSITGTAGDEFYAGFQ